MSAQVNFTMPLCPITLEPMTEPVIDPEGNTYEKSAIEEWLLSNNTSQHIFISSENTNCLIQSIEITHFITHTNTGTTENHLCMIIIAKKMKAK